MTRLADDQDEHLARGVHDLRAGDGDEFWHVASLCVCYVYNLIRWVDFLYRGAQFSQLFCHWGNRFLIECGQQGLEVHHLVGCLFCTLGIDSGCLYDSLAGDSGVACLSCFIEW